MLNNIWWASYVYTIAMVVVIYYTSVAIVSNYLSKRSTFFIRKISKDFDPASTLPIIPHQNNIVIAKDELNG